MLPADFRGHPVLREYSAALALMAWHHARGSADGARDGYRSARTELGELVPPHVVDDVLAVYRAEGFRLAAEARAAGLVERAMLDMAAALGAVNARVPSRGRAGRGRGAPSA